MAFKSYRVLNCTLLLLMGAFSLKAQQPTGNISLTQLDTLPVPSPSNPVLNNTYALKSKNRIAYDLYAGRQNFLVNPEAKATGFAVFPGTVPIDAERVTQKLSIAVHVGSQGLTDNLTLVQYRLHSTRLYVPAGEKVTISLNNADINSGLVARIGVHDDNLFNLNKFTRIPVSLIKNVNLLKKETEIFSPYGGLLLIAIPDTCTLKKLTVTVKGAVRSPYFKLGETNEKEWIASIRNNPAPWAELATDNIVLTVPSYRIRKLDNPVKLMKFWDEVMNADADLAAMAKNRKHQERIIVDNDVAFGYMFATLDKMVVPDDQTCGWMLDEEYIRANGFWGTFHELGHRHQYWPFEDSATQEVTVNLYTMHVYDKVLHKGIYQHENLANRAMVFDKIITYMNSPNTGYEQWRNDPFLAVSMYIQIIDTFGWDPIKAINTTYRNTPADQFPKTVQQKMDFRFVTLCKATNSNLSRFFKVWRIPISDNARKQAESYKEWFPKELAAYK
jgi:hypothetical protein